MLNLKRTIQYELTNAQMYLISKNCVQDKYYQLCLLSIVILHPRIHRIARGATTDKNLADATIRLGSVPSIQSSTHSEDRYIESKKFGHMRTPSNASSKASSNRSHSVSTTSCSPNTMHINKLQNEKNAREETTPSLYESRSQLSQTESEIMIKGYSHSQSRLTNSTSSSPHSSILNVSMPQYQYHHGVSPYDLHHPHHRRNYSQTTIEEDTVLEYPTQYQRPHQYQNHSLSISGSEMDTRPPSEVGIFPFTVGMGEQPKTFKVIQA